MFTDNRTAYRLRSITVPVSDARSVACFTLRVAYLLRDGGQLEQAEIMTEPSGKIGASPFCSGTSWSLSGTVERPKASTISLQASAIVGDRLPLNISIEGNRRWVLRNGQLAVSAPEPFDRMSLAAEHAFGGTVVLPPGERDGLPHPALTIPHSWNPRGRGYALDPQSAIGLPLPNVEFSDDRVAGWPAQPDPAVLAPEVGQVMIRLPRTGADFEGRELEEHLRVLHPSHRRAFGDPLRSGARFVLSGFRPETFAFALPASPVRVQLRQSRRWHDTGFHIRHVHVQLDHQRIEVLYGHSASFSPTHRVTDARVEGAI